MMRKHMSVKKMVTDEVCVFSRGKTAKNGSVSAQRSTWQGAKHLKIERCVSIFLIFVKNFLKSTENGGFVVVVQSIVLCVWICNSEFRHARIFVNAIFIYVLLLCDGKARCFFGIKMPAGWQNFIENLNCPDCVGWSIVNWVEWLWNPSDSFVICFCWPESAQRSKEFLSFWLYWPIKTLH